MDRRSEDRPQPPAGGALHPADIIRILRTHVGWWAVPTVVCALLAGAYLLVAPRQWRATQALIVRPEAASVSEERLGKFSDLSEMKTLQETILELAKSQSVVRATLREVGPPRSYRRSTQWPTALDVEAFREDIDMRPPGGAEFGKTEVFYLSVRNSDRDRASALAAALCDQLVQRMQELRDQRAQSMIAELQKTVAMADGDLADQTVRLSKFEAKIGADLAELRNLNADVASQGELSQEVQAIETERRANESRQHENESLLKLLMAAENDPRQLLATPNSLLVSQPAVSQLKNALVTAQLQTANLLASRSEKHPFVVAACEAEEFIREQLHKEVANAIRGLKVDIELNADREASLAAKWTTARGRQSHLAESRAEYAGLVASVENHTRLVETARKYLADARARQAGAHSASVISRIDGVEAGIRPAGPGRKVIATGGGVAGLLLGLGFVFLFANAAPTHKSSAVGNVNESYTTNGASRRPTSREHELLKGHLGDNEASANGAPIAKPVAGAESNFGMFHGMTTQEAIRSVERLSE